MGSPRTMRLFSLILISVCLDISGLPQKRPLEDLPGTIKKTLAAYLGSHGMTPEDYVISKFDTHDIILIGEHHFIKHDVEFIQGLIPTLYENGVMDLGIEFGCYELQEKADLLVTAETYDEDLARWLVFQWGSYWPYVEYLNLYRKAWRLNQSLPDDAPKFRIVGLDYRARWDLLTENMPERRWQRIFFKGPRDKHMADVIMREFINQGKKALIYAGQHHTFTRYHAPVYDFKGNTLVRLEKNSMGNRIYRKIRDQVFNICLHYPWTTIKGPKTYDYPVDGAVDRIMQEFSGKRVGFDVVDSPFGSLGDSDALYVVGRRDFSFSDFCDGYIFLKPFSEYEGCSVDPLFITEENFKVAVSFLPKADIKKKIKTAAQFLYKMKWDADFRRLYPDLQ